MSDQEKQSGLARQLRQAAEEKLSRSKGLSGITQEKTVEDLLHELQVHQIELEMQNEELCRAQLVQEESHNRYADLYDFSPVSYFTLSRNGRITAANLTGAALLGVPRKELIDQGFGRFVAPEAIDRWDRHRLDALQQEGTVSCELALKREDGSVFSVLLDSIRVIAEDGANALRSTVIDISELKQAEQALRDAHWRLASIIEGTHAGTWEWNIQTGQTVFNEVWAQIIGYTLDELAPISIKTWEMFTHPDDLKQAAELLERHFAGELPYYECECRMKHKDGHWVWVLDRGRVITHSGDGKPLLMFGTHSDITKRKQAEKETNSQKEILERVFDSIPIMINYFDETGKIKMVNRELVEKLGWTFDDWKTDNILAKSYPDPDDFKEVLDFMINKPMGWRDFKTTTKYGTVIDATWINLSLPNGVSIGIGQDITDRKQAEAALRESEERFDQLAEQSGVITWEVDTRGLYTYVSHVSEVVWGYHPDELVGRMYFYDLHPEPEREAFKTACFATFEQKEPFRNLENNIQARDGRQVWVSTNGIPLLNSDGTLRGYRGSDTDITERKRLEQEATKARADFLYAVSHELKTPLFLMASAQELLETLPADQRAGRFLEYGEIWNRNLHRLRHLIENLVDSQRTEGMGLKITLVPTDIGEILQQTLKDVELLAQCKRIFFRLQVDELPEIPADPESIHRLMENLLTNAIKFSPPGGEVEISLAPQGEEALFTVRDYGPGIAASEILQLFKPFQRTSGANRAVIPGAGLGLYTAKLIAEAHSGSISLASEEGKGTIVTVRLPWKKVGIIGT